VHAMILLERGGPVLVALLGLSILAWTVALNRWIVLRRDARNDRGAGEIARVLTREGREAAARLCARGETVEERVLSVSLLPGDPGRRRFEGRIRPILVAEERTLLGPLGLVAACAAAAPLLGLLGTVLGMIRTFGALGDEPVSGVGFAEGIGEALLTTQAGLVVAVPMILLHFFLQARGRRCIARAEREARRIEALLAHGGP